jgi:hypothetical protein
MHAFQSKRPIAYGWPLFCTFIPLKVSSGGLADDVLHFADVVRAVNGADVCARCSGVQRK